MKFYLPIIFIFITVVGCRDNNRRLANDEPTLSSKVGGELEVIKIYADSTVKIFQACSEYLRKHPGGEHYLLERYQEEVSFYYQSMVIRINEVNKIYVSKDLSEVEYELFKSQLQISLERLKIEKRKLQTSGVRFELQNPYITYDTIK